MFSIAKEYQKYDSLHIHHFWKMVKPYSWHLLEKAIRELIIILEFSIEFPSFIQQDISDSE